MALCIQIISLANGQPSPFDGQWLVEYDPTRPGRAPDGKPMTAHIVCSPHQASARRFKDPTEAHAYWCLKSGRPAPADMPFAPPIASLQRRGQRGQVYARHPERGIQAADLYWLDRSRILDVAAVTTARQPALPDDETALGGGDYTDRWQHPDVRDYLDRIRTP